MDCHVIEKAKSKRAEKMELALVQKQLTKIVSVLYVKRTELARETQGLK